MPTITKEAIQWFEDEMESKEAQISDLEEELEAALDENATLKALIARMKATLQVE